jgi:heme a synthase
MASSSTAAAAGLGRAEDAPQAVRIWLVTIVLLVAAMILVGGATRLTESGLSITEWQLVMGTIPPLTDAQWATAFDAYRQIPQYLELKRGMSLEEFKTIYWWEWAHRFLGRFIGFAFLLPLIGFWAAGAIPRWLKPHLVTLFLLGGLQGAVGWYMVQSGLVDRLSVSQYRLALHFGIAIVIFGYALWLVLELSHRAVTAWRRPTAVTAAWGVLALIFLQLLLGAFVAGLHAGQGYNTWPSMDGYLIPPGLGAMSPWYLNFFENPLTVQFNHRMLGYAVVLTVIGQAAWVVRSRAPAMLQRSGFALVLLSLAQAALGIWTLLAQVPISLGLAHQAGAVLLFGVAVWHLHNASHAARSDQRRASA